METNQTTQLQVLESNETALYLITKAEIDTQIATAKAFPRSLAIFYSKAKEMVMVSEEVAASCSYSMPRAGKIIEGGSVRLAEIIAACYTNIRAGSRVIGNDGKMIKAQGICHDLENNNSVTIEVDVRITNKKGETYNDDMQIVVGNAACAKAYRNAIFKVIPKAMIDEIEQHAKLCAKGTQATLEKRRAAAIEYFIGLKITEKEIFEILGVKGIKEIDLEKLSVLTGMKSAYRNEGISLKELFHPSETATNSTPINKEDERDELMLKDCKTVYEVQELILKNPAIKSELADARIAEIEIGIKK